MKYYEEKTECDCGTLLFSKETGKHYLVLGNDNFLRCPKCEIVHRMNQVVFR